MDEASWPADHRQLKKKAGRTKGKGQAKVEDIARDYPCLEYGSLNSLTLSSGNGRLEWEAVTGTSKGNFYPLGTFYPSVLSDGRRRKEAGGKSG